MFCMTDIKYGARESVRESTWLICEAAKVLCELGSNLNERDQDELLNVLRDQAERLSDSISDLLAEKSRQEAC